ncbi:hypothetical protein [Nannocystis pusilla]|uniref:hypothetical protein n=1 Tax=Nannocystis pusilla TaxID=889268 RepID=UPI003B7B55AF
MRRQAPIKRSSTGQRTIAGSKSADVANLDDRPLSIHITRDGKHLVVPLPYELWILGVNSFEVVRTIECANPEPSVSEGAKDGSLWIGGHHLYFGSVFSTALTKVGSKLGDFVDRVALVRPSVLCGVGATGEILFDVDKENPLHRRKVSERTVTGLVNLDGRALWADGSATAWLIDPDRPSGYTQLKLRATSPTDVDAEGIAALGTTTTGRAVLCARDGAVAWTGKHLRVDGERFLAWPRARPPRWPAAATSATSTCCGPRACCSGSSSSSRSPRLAKRTALSLCPRPRRRGCNGLRPACWSSGQVTARPGSSSAVRRPRACSAGCGASIPTPSPGRRSRPASALWSSRAPPSPRRPTSAPTSRRRAAS